jgi:hypothetical protein
MSMNMLKSSDIEYLQEDEALPLRECPDRVKKITFVTVFAECHVAGQRPIEATRLP